MRQYIVTLRTEETWKVNSDTEKNSFLFFTRSHHGNGDRAPQLQRSVDRQPQGTKSCPRAGPAFKVLLALMGIIIRLSSVSCLRYASLKIFPHGRTRFLCYACTDWRRKEQQSWFNRQCWLKPDGLWSSKDRREGLASSPAAFPATSWL